MLQGSELTIDGCLSLMDYYSSAHFACHASQNAADPLESRFIFHEGYLNLLAVIRQILQDVDLAFLSACQTSTGEEKLSDEAVHLAAGMLAAGYRRVVPTMWSIGDRHAPGVSFDFYHYLWKDKKDRFEGAKSAQALHHAIQSLRLRLNDDSEKSLLAWIPYVHFGY
ncbi:CHAT domain-containing protein [Ephemerocybe angulata]|uniref:CHAT domain-containing protein n=1 Tax=Ephemerocybe angulata TaxID=980116 RepID=A0A8H6MCS8_9AGAR|nr:CHAT domain-containing protein [Tulosesus angulatus]